MSDYATPGAITPAGLGLTASATELNFVGGVSSAIQTQLNSKADQTQLDSKAEVVAVPASATAPGTAGQIAFASGTLYICIATDTWEKVTIATWS